MGRGVRVGSKWAIAAASLVVAGFVATGCGDDDEGEGQAAQSGEDAAAILNYKEPDREQYLFDCAKKEGKVVLYTSSSAADEAYKPAFEKKYPGVTLENYIGKAELPSKLMEEERGGQHRFDVLSDVYGNMPLDDEYFQPFYTPRFEDIKPELRSEYFVSASGYVLGLGYNPEQVPEDEVPDSWEAMLDPEFKGEIWQSTDATQPVIMGMLQQQFGDEFIDKFADQIRLQQGGGRAVADQVIAGTAKLGSNVSASYYQRDYLTDGAPFRWRPLDPAMAFFQAVSISKHVPHPCAAALFVDWLLSEEGEQLHKDLGNASPYVGTPLLPFEIKEEPPQDEWNVIFNTDPMLIEDFGSYAEAQQAWNEQFRTKFLEG